MMDVQVGSVIIETTQSRGHTPEAVAKRCVDKMISIAESAPEPLKQQAHAFRKNMEVLVTFYIKEAIKSDRTTLYNELVKAGEEDIADIVRRA